MSKDSFLDVTARRLALVDSTEEVRQMFRVFDRGCRGFITRDDMRQVSLGMNHGRAARASSIRVLARSH